ncbi:MAG: LLM class flavin-dependent oxidoreductase [Actinomycetes bacterium]
MTTRPPLALSLPVTGADTRAGIELAQRMVGRGFGAVWASEVNGPDAFTQLGALAVTTEADLGVAVVPVQTRTPMVLGMTAVTLAELSGGRFTLGVGASSEVIVAGWAGQDFSRPLTDVRETVEALRPMLSGERSTYEGERVTVGGYRPHATPPARVPLVLGALNPRSLEMVGELAADGVCLNQMTAAHTKVMLERVCTGADEAGVSLPEDFAVVARLFCCVTDQPDAVRDMVRHTFAPYIATSVYNRFYRWQGFEAEAEGVLAAGRDREAAAAAISDRLVDEVFCIGSAEQVADRVAEFVAAGVTVPVVQPFALGVEQAEQMLTDLQAAWDRAA